MKDYSRYPEGQGIEQAKKDEDCIKVYFLQKVKNFASGKHWLTII